MSKTMRIKFDGEEYTLEYTRASAKAFEQMGFSPDDILTRPNMAVIPFVFCAFKQHHSTIKMSKVEKIYEQIPANSKADFLAALREMYAETYEYLFGGDEESDEGNAVWETSWKKTED